MERKRQSFSLKLFKQYQCVSFSPNMEFLSVACGSSIDIFAFCDTFNYINYHNYGGNIECIKWLNINTMIIIIHKQDQMGSYKSIMTEIILNNNINISDLLKDQLDLTQNIIEIIIQYLATWKIKHRSIDLIMNNNNIHSMNINKKTNDDYLLKICPQINDDRGGILVGTKSRPDFIVSLV